MCVEGSSLLLFRGSKPWQGRNLEGSGGSGARGSSLLVLRGSKPWQGRNLEGSGGSGGRFWTPAVLCGRVVTFGLAGLETVAGACSRGLRHFWSRGLQTLAGAYCRGLRRVLLSFRCIQFTCRCEFTHTNPHQPTHMRTLTCKIA